MVKANRRAHSKKKKCAGKVGGGGYIRKFLLHETSLVERGFLYELNSGSPLTATRATTRTSNRFANYRHGFRRRRPGFIPLFYSTLAVLVIAYLFPMRAMSQQMKVVPLKFGDPYYVPTDVSWPEVNVLHPWAPEMLEYELLEGDAFAEFIFRSKIIHSSTPYDTPNGPKTAGWWFPRIFQSEKRINISSASDAEALFPEPNMWELEAHANVQRNGIRLSAGDPKDIKTPFIKMRDQGIATTCALDSPSSKSKCTASNRCNCLDLSKRYLYVLTRVQYGPVHGTITVTKTCYSGSAPVLNTFGNATVGCNNRSLACPRGTFISSSNFGLCTYCPGGYFTAKPGQSYCSKCGEKRTDVHESTTNYVGDVYESTLIIGCSDCPKGTFGQSVNLSVAETSTTNCTVCPKGYYSDKSANTYCTACPKNYFNAFDTQDKHDSSDDCTGCPALQLTLANGSEFCQPCPPGAFTINFEEEKLQSIGCVTCPAGFVQPQPQSVACSKCSVGEYQTERGKTACNTCLPGTYGDRKGMQRCKLCLEGQFRLMSEENERSLNFNCSACQAGFHQPGKGWSFCLPCLPGMYEAENASIQCDPCGKNKYSDSVGAVACKQCPLGYLADMQNGSTGCTAVRPGSYMNAESDATEKLCDPGFKCAGMNAMQEACPLGRYASDQGSVECFPCSPGKFSRTKNSTSCAACPRGWFQEEEGQPNCKKPARGYIAVGGTATIGIAEGWMADNCTKDGVCEAMRPCRAGTFGNRSRFCEKCPAGQSSSPGSIQCSSCGKGRYAAVEGSATCEACHSGYFQQQNRVPSVRCEKCPSGFQQNGRGESACVKGNWLRPEDCTNEQYLDDRSLLSSEWTCKPCPRGGTCLDPTTTRKTIQTLFGWWRNHLVDALQDDNSTACPLHDGDLCRNKNDKWARYVFVECLYHPACLGVPNQALANLYHNDAGEDLAMIGNVNASSTCAMDLGFRNQSRLCHACDRNYRRASKGRCSVCSETSSSDVGLMVFGCFLALSLVCYIVVSTISDAGKQTLSSAVRKILLNHLQVASLAKSFPLRWPPALESLFEFQGAISMLGDTLINPDCIAGIENATSLFYMKQMVCSIVPFVAVVVAFIFWKYFGACNKIPFSARHEVQNSDVNGTPAEVTITPKDKFVVSVTIILYLIYPTLCMQTFENFDCINIGGRDYLSIDLEEPCWEGRHVMFGLLLGVGQGLVYVMGLPLIMVFLLWRNHRLAGGLKRQVILVRYGLFFSAFTEERYYWELIITARKISVVMLGVVGKGMGPMRQAQLALGLLVCCIPAEVIGKPYRISTARHKVLSRLEISSLCSLWWTMWCGTLISSLQDPSAASNGGGHGVVVFLSVIVVVMNLSIILWLVFQVIAEWVVENKDSSFGRCIGRHINAFALCGEQKQNNIAEANQQQEEDEGHISKASNTANKTSVTVELTDFNMNPLTCYKPGQGVTSITTGSPPSWLGSPQNMLTRVFHEASSKYFLYDEETGESRWEEEEHSEVAETETGTEREIRTAAKQFFEFFTDEGDSYYMPTSGDRNETLWDLPDGAEIIESAEFEHT